MKKELLIFGILLLGVLFSLSSVSADGLNVCCEKTNDGAWCQNSVDENCDSDFRQTPTSCDATNFCKQGCCYESDDGLCVENTPERTCSEKNGIWSEGSECNIPQCNLGCCVLGDQAALVTLVGCKRMSADYGLITDFRSNIQDENLCIGVAQSQDKGACVYEVDFDKICKFTTKKDCLNKGVLNVGEGTVTNSSVGFFENYLCTAKDLNTTCGKTWQTTCVDGKDEVYFVDSCGNTANIYNSIEGGKQEYWERIILKNDSCGSGDLEGNAGSVSCGNCDYFSGSYCKEAGRVGARPSKGEYICDNLDCDEIGRKHGESWCEYDGNVGEGRDAVGSRHFRKMCVNGEELIEPCDDFRQKICMEDSIETSKGGFSQANCIVNRWHSCILQTDEEDCENIDKRDCYWVQGAYFSGAVDAESSGSGGGTFSGGTNTGGFGGGVTGNAIFGDDDEDEGERATGVILNSGSGLCLPTVPTGLRFWEDSSDAPGVCNQGNAQCVVKFTEGLIGDEECEENCECLEDSWATNLNNICTSLGDCGGYVNYKGKYTDDGYDWVFEGQKKTLSQGIVNQIRSKAGV